MSINSICLCREDYQSEEVYHAEILKAITLLLDARYIMTVRYDVGDSRFTVIDFQHADQSLGAEYPCWLSPEEFDIVEYHRLTGDKEVDT